MDRPGHQCQCHRPRLYGHGDEFCPLLDPANPRYQQITDRIPANRWGTGDDMKGACIFLASHASDYLGGVIIPVDGGYLVK